MEAVKYKSVPSKHVMQVDMVDVAARDVKMHLKPVDLEEPSIELLICGLFIIM